MTTIITHAIAFLAGLAGGWLIRRRYGAKADAIAIDIKK